MEMLPRRKGFSALRDLSFGHGQGAGPYLLAVVGRPVASVGGFTCSAPMQALAATGAVWDEATLDKFLQAPMDFVKGTKMMVPPVRRDTERADLIAFLKSHM